MVILFRTLLVLLSVGLITGSMQAQTANLFFDGADDRVTLPNDALNTIGTGPFTVEAWVRGDEAEQVTHPRILSNRDAVNNGFMFGFHGLWGGSQYMMLNMQLDGLNYILINNGSYNASILDGACHHVAVSKGPDSLRFYVDGMHIGSKVLQGNPSAATGASSMLIGNDAPDPQPFHGNLSQVRLWDHVRTQTEIAADMGMSIPGTTPGLLGYWELNEGSGQTVLDRTNTANGLVGATPNMEPTDPEWQPDGCPIELPSGKCMLFDGVDDQVTMANGVLNTIGTGSFTVEAWVRGLEADQPTHPRLLSNRDMVDNGFMFGFHGLWGGSQYKMLNMQLDGLNYILINNGSYNGNILDGTCHHVAVSKGPDSLRFYVDGTHIGSKVLQGNPSVATGASSMLIGNDGPDPHPFHGNLSQVRLWDQVRTQAEIAADMGTSIPGTTTGLVGYWELNEGAGQSILDKTNNTNGMLGSTLTGEYEDPSWVDDCCALVPTPTSITEPDAHAAISIHPNPVQDMIQVEVPGSTGVFELSISDITGRVVLRTLINARSRTVLDVSHLRTGVYMLTHRSGPAIRTIRFVKD